MRVVLRILGTWLLGMAVILMIVDGTRSLGASSVVVTSLGDAWNGLSAPSLAAVEGFIDSRLLGPVLDPLLGVILGWPGFAVLGIPGIALLVAGRSRRSRRFVKQDQF